MRGFGSRRRHRRAWEALVSDATWIRRRSGDHVAWTTVGTLDSEARATVDPAGLVTTRPGRWSLDWWIGADDRWHFPALETAVRQTLVDRTPVVETAMRVPGGDAVQRVYGVAARADVVV